MRGGITEPMKKIAIFLTIMAICGDTYGATTNLKIIEPADNTRVHKYVPNLKISPLYTIDKREYVSRDKAPFSAVVGLKDPYSKNWCSGTLTADGVVVTAKHCVFDGANKTYKPLESIIINSINGDTGVKRRIASGRDIYPDSGYDDTYDWALLAPKANIKSTVNVSKLTGNGTSDVVVAGYGALKILSNQEIRKIRQEYAKWLNRGTGTNIASSSGVDLQTRSSLGSQFVREIIAGQINGIPADIFQDTHRLKASYCHATISNASQNEIACQTWGGNSGGPVFYKYNNKWYLYGIHVSGNGIITDNRNTYAVGIHMVPINVLIPYYRKLVSQLREGNTNEN